MTPDDTTADTSEDDLTDAPPSETDDLADPYDDHDHHDDESGLARKALTALGFLVAGAVLVLWLGPRIAPNLPSGLEPVARWLTPGATDYEQEIAQLRADIKADLEALPSNLTVTQIENIVAGRIANVEGRLVARLNELNTQFVIHDTTDLDARLTALETRVEGLRAELQALTEQLSVVTSSGGVVSADTSERIAVYAAALEGLKAEVEALAAQNGTLSQKLEDVTITAQQEIEVAQAERDAVEVEAERQRIATLTQASLTSLQAALTSGGEFSGVLDQLESVGVTVPDALRAAQSGVKTLPQLRNAWPEAAHAALRASILAGQDEGLVGSVSTFLQAQVASRSLTPQEGDDADAILSRAEAALKDDDVSGALSELEMLSTEAQASDAFGDMRDWLADARLRLEAEEAIDALIANIGAAK